MGWMGRDGVGRVEVGWGEVGWSGMGQAPELWEEGVGKVTMGTMMVGDRTRWIEWGWGGMQCGEVCSVVGCEVW